MHLYPPYFSMEVKYGALTVTEKIEKGSGRIGAEKIRKMATRLIYTVLIMRAGHRREGSQRKLMPSVGILSSCYL